MKKAFSLTALSALLKQTSGVNSTQLLLAKRVKEKAQSKRYKNTDYMSRVSKNFNINPSEKRAVQKIKKLLKVILISNN